MRFIGFVTTFVLGAFLALPVQCEVLDVDDDGVVGPNEVLELLRLWKQEATGSVGSATPSWSLTGNAGIDPDRDVLGTTDGQPLNIIVNGARAMALRAGTESPNLIGGYHENVIIEDISGGTIGGGGSERSANSVGGDYGTVGGGRGNRVESAFGTVGGGEENRVQGTNGVIGGGSGNSAAEQGAVVGGGEGNQADGVASTISGGISNSATGERSTIGGGSNHRVGGYASTVPGGDANAAQGDYSFAAGRRAQAVHEGAFVWADSSDEDFVSTSSDEFAVRASGGVRFQTDKLIVAPAKSYLWISGNGARKFHESDSTVIDMGNKGEAIIRRGSQAGAKNVMLPITVMAPLYGQNVRIARVGVSYKGETENDFLSAILLRRQTGLCDTSDCYDSIAESHGTFPCDRATNPDGCFWSFSVDSDAPPLTSESGILYLTLEFTFGSDTSRIWLGGVKLTLEHE